MGLPRQTWEPKEDCRLVRQFKADAVFPEKDTVTRREGEAFMDWWERQCEASARWSEKHQAAINDPRNMTSAFLEMRVRAHDEARSIFGASPFATARTAARVPNEKIEGYRAELKRREAAKDTE